MDQGARIDQLETKSAIKVIKDLTLAVDELSKICSGVTLGPSLTENRSSALHTWAIAFAVASFFGFVFGGAYYADICKDREMAKVVCEAIKQGKTAAEIESLMKLMK